MNKEIRSFVKRIDVMRNEIDAFFLIIQSDRALMKEYLDFVSKADLKKVNMLIGMEIGRLLGKKSIGRRKSKSVLIQSYSELH